jgi:hypothetical protein
VPRLIQLYKQTDNTQIRSSVRLFDLWLVFGSTSGGEGDVLRRGLTQRWPQREDHERSRRVTDTGKGLKIVKRVGRFRPNSIPTALVGLVMLPTSDEGRSYVRMSGRSRLGGIRRLALGGGSRSPILATLPSSVLQVLRGVDG